MNNRERQDFYTGVYFEEVRRQRSSTTHTTVMAALLHYGLTCYDGRHCIVALRDLGMSEAAAALDKALSNRIYSDVGQREWAAEESAATREP